MNIITFCILSIQVKNIFCSIILPLYTLPRENYIKKYSNDSLKEIFDNEFKTNFYTFLEIGTPLQKVPLLVNIETNSLAIASCYPKINDTSNKFHIYDFTNNFLKQYDFFDETKSNTFIPLNYTLEAYYKAYYASSSNDSFSFFKDIHFHNKILDNNITFQLIKNVEDNITGEVGLNIYDPNYENFNSFLKVLRTHELIDNYNWYFYFDSPWSKDGKLILGSLPHEDYPNKYSSDDLFYAKCSANYFVIYWEMEFDKIYSNNKTYKNNDIDDKSDNGGKAYFENVIEFKFDSNLIFGTIKYEKYLSFILNDLIEGKKCFNDTMIGDSVYSKFKFYYCKNEKSIKDKLYNIIPILYFYSHEFNHTFELTNNEIIKEKGGYIYILILFDGVSSKWKLGNIFSLKYKFVFNPDTKQIGFYKNIKNANDIDSKDYSFIFKIILIIVLSLLLILLGFILGKMIYGLKRKKRANELTDDYDYVSNENNKGKDKEEYFSNDYKNSNNIN